jgi:hypothetical protein
VGIPPAPVEAAISASIVLLAVELARPAQGPPTWTRRAPWAVALVFGLLHGFGFAGALAEVGLPRNEIPAALVSFNVGVELGQLGFIAALLLVGRVVGRKRWSPKWTASVLPTAMGSLAACWCFESVAGFFARGSR